MSWNVGVYSTQIRMDLLENPSHLQTPRLTRVLLFKEERPPIETFVDTFENRINNNGV